MTPSELSEFNKFLLANGAHKDFYVNLRRDSAFRASYSYPVEPFRFITDVNPMHVIVQAFAWAQSPQQWDFWCNIRNKWEDHLIGRKKLIALNQYTKVI